MTGRWTPDEIEYVSEHAGIVGYAELSRRLHRSKAAIKLYRCRHKLPRFIDNFYSYTLLAAELGKSRATLRKWHSRGWLAGKRATWACVHGKRPMIFVEENIVEFLKVRSYLFDHKKIPNPYFRNVVKDAGLPGRNS